MTRRQIQLHMMQMRYLVYKDAIVKAIRSAHQEMKDYARSVAEMLEERKRKP